MADPRLDLHVLLPHATEGWILVAADGGLPRTELRLEREQPAIRAIVAWLRDALGVTSPVLETHLRWDGPDGVEPDPIPGLAWVEGPPGGWQPPAGLRWAPIGDVSRSVPEAIAPRLATLLDERGRGGSSPPLRPRWARPGWMGRASSWLSERMTELGRPATGSVEQAYLRGISALLRSDTTAGSAFLKAVFLPFHHEPAVTALLAGRYPDRVPTVLATEPDEGWLVMDDLGSRTVRRDGSEADHAAAIRTLVAIQRDLATPAGREAILATGAPNRPLDTLAESFAAALGSPSVAASAKVPLDPAAMRALVADSIARVVALGFPATLVHGDFHPGNVALVEGRAVIYDWSDAAIADPSLDLATWPDEDEPADRFERSVDAWLDAWIGTVDPTAVRSALVDILRVGAAYQVVSYVAILENLEPATRYTVADGLDAFLAMVEAPTGLGTS